jgi:ATP-dependent Clp endopeptidase proteolytic subunit ClpP
MSKSWSLDVVENFAGGGETANLFISGPIYDGESYDTELAGSGTLVNAIGNLDKTVDKIHVKIQSPGGSIAAGLAIYNALENHPVPVETEICGMAASMGSVIFQAGNVRKMPRHSFQMIHRATGGAHGNADEVAHSARVIQQHEDELVDIYAKRTGHTSAKIREMISVDNYMNGPTCLENGFCDELIGEEKDDETENRLTPANLAFMAEKGMSIPANLMPVNLVNPDGEAPQKPTDDPGVDPGNEEPDSGDAVDPNAAQEPPTPEVDPAPPSNDDDSSQEPSSEEQSAFRKLYNKVFGIKEEEEKPENRLDPESKAQIDGLQTEISNLKAKLDSEIAAKKAVNDEVKNLKAQIVTTEKEAVQLVARLGHIDADEVAELEKVPPMAADENTDDVQSEIDALRSQLKTETDPAEKARISRELRELRNSQS